MWIIEFIRKIFQKKEQKSLPKVNEVPKIFNDLKEIGRNLGKSINIENITLNNSEEQFPKFQTQFSDKQIIEITKRFYESLGIKENINIEINIKKGNIKDLFQSVNQIAQSFSKIEKNNVYSKVVPKCVEKIFENYINNLTDSQLKELDLNKQIIQDDIILMNIQETMKLQNELKEPKELNIRHILGKMYSTKFFEIMNRDRLNKDGQFRLLLQTISNIKSGQRTILEVDKDNSMQLKSLGEGVIHDTNNKINKFILNKKLAKIMEQIEIGKDFTENILGQEICINLQEGLPFLLIIPKNIENNSTLIMESNNLETNNKKELFKQGIETAKHLLELSKSKSPILIPILPSEKEGPYWQQLSSECFKKDKNIHLKIMQTIEKSKAIIKKKRNIEINDKIFLNGYSSSGVFAQRLALIYPEIIDTACIGGASGSIPIIDSRIDYPIGIGNYEKIFQKAFNKEEYKKINFEYYVGSLETYIKTNRNGNIEPMHDMSYFNRSIPTEIGRQQRLILGTDLFDRAKKAVEILKEQGVKINHNVLYNCIHNDKEATIYNNEHTGISIITGIRDEQDKIIKNALTRMIGKQKENEKSKEDIPS
jgi:hypothetical protein